MLIISKFYGKAIQISTSLGKRIQIHCYLNKCEVT